MVELIAVCYKKSLAVVLEDLGLPVYLGTDFALQIVEYPYIVIACKDMYLDSCIDQLRKCPQEANKAFGHYILVLEPVVEYVPDKHNGTCVLSDAP